jgi:hypothetical protein
MGKRIFGWWAEKVAAVGPHPSGGSTADEDINTLAAIIPSVEILDPITQS